MVLVISFFFATYFVILLFFMRGWQKAFIGSAPAGADERFISVIIPVRNEARTISFLLDDLMNQRNCRFEVILVDDHSEDDTDLIITKRIEGDNRFARVKNEGEGKKMAITTGVKAARGEIIVTTDADCRVTAEWLSLISRSFHDAHVKMVFGAVKLQSGHTLFSKLQTIEFASLIGSAVATYGLGAATMCNGANVAYRKAVFEEVGGYQDNLNIPSGDDEFLMRKILAKYPGGLRFLASPEGVVITQALPSVIDFLQQRIRWAGKWRYNSSIVTKILAIYIVLFQGSAIFSIGILLSGAFRLLLPLWTIKIILEFVFLFRVCSFLQIKWHTMAFLILQIIYPFYVVTVGMLSNFIRYQWKGRPGHVLSLTIHAEKH